MKGKTLFKRVDFQTWKKGMPCNALDASTPCRKLLEELEHEFELMWDQRDECYYTERDDVTEELLRNYHNVDICFTITVKQVWLNHKTHKFEEL